MRMERMEFNFGSWINPNRAYIYAEIKDYAVFELSPYETKTVYLVQLGNGYGYKEGQWAVISEWRQEGHPQYSDCDEAGIQVFDSEDEARRHFEELVKEYSELYLD